MKLRFEINEAERKRNGVRERVYVVRYWWPARRGEPRRSKVDPKTFRDKRNATGHAVEMLRAIEEHEAGRGMDPFADVPKDVAGWVEKFLAALAAGEFARKKGRRPKPEHVKRTRKRLELMFEHFGLRTVGDFVRFEQEAAEQFALLQEDLRAEAGEKLRTFGDKTRDEFVFTLRQLCGYLVKRRVLSSNPVADVPRLYGDHSATFFRRALLVEEIDALLRAAEATGDAGKVRATLWALAIYTGFRLSEIAATTWGDVMLDGSPRVELDGSRTKNGQHAEQALPGWLADRLRSMKGLAMPTAPLFPGIDWHNLNDRLRLDAVAAGLGEVEKKRAKTAKGEWTYWLVWLDPRGPKHRFDFHSLRHTYNTLVGQTATNPRDAQELGRHSDERTNRRYWHGDRARRRAVVDALPAPAAVCTTCAPCTPAEATAGNPSHRTFTDRSEATACAAAL